MTPRSRRAIGSVTMKFALGQAVPRTEDPRLLTGRGRYTDDLVLPRLAHAYVLRSPHAHVRIGSMDIRAAQQMPGVLAVLTGEDWAAEGFGAPRPVIPRQRRDGSPMFVPLRPALVREDRKSTRLNSSHVSISYAVFCLKK